MTTVDWAIVAFVALMALWGYWQGLLVSALSLLGFAAGAFAGSRLVPLLLSEGSRSPYAPLFTLLGALVIGALGAVLLESVGAEARERLTFRFARGLDGAAGGLLFAALGLALVWIGGAVALQTPGARALRKDIQRSTILARLNRELPPTGPVLNALARFDPLPTIEGPVANVPEPNAAILKRPGVDAARGGVVRVLGTACGLAIAGSAWVARPQVVVTNAHVVAGEHDTVVETGSGARFAATAIAFDVSNDVAILRVPGLDSRALEFDPDPSRGESVAILGYPLDGPFAASVGRLGTTRAVISVDTYGSGPLTRSMTALRGDIRSGNSGGPAVDTHGRVATTVFAATTRGRAGGFGVPNAVVKRVLRGAESPVGTGSCA